MADDERRRAVSGEIMTGPEGGSTDGPQRRIAPGDDVVDAEYDQRAPVCACRIASIRVRLVDRVRRAPAAGMDMLRRNEPEKASRSSVPGGPLFWTTSAALVLAAFWVSGGHALVRNASIAGDRGAEERASHFRRHLARRCIGRCARSCWSTARRPMTALRSNVCRRIEIAVTGNDGLVTRYRLGTSGRPLSPGETFDFSSRLDAPKNGVKTVTVTFAD